MSRSFIAGYTGQRDKRIEQCYAQQLNSRYSGEFGSCHYGDAHFFFGDSFDTCHSHHSNGKYSGAAKTNDSMVCFSAYFREAPANWQKDRESLADALLRGLQENSTDYVNKLRGSFVIAWYQSGKLSLIRDRAGQHSLYHCELGERLCFAVEPKALMNLEGFKREIDPAGIARYFTFSFQPGHHTMLRGLHKLKPATIISFDGKKASSTLHYSHAEQASCAWREVNDTHDWLADFNATFSLAVARCEPHKSGVGAFLSGGLDSSLVAAEAQHQRDLPLSTYSLHFGKKYDNELSFARELANFIGSDHHEIELSTNNMLEKLADMVTLLDDPIGDPVTFGNYEISRQLGGIHTSNKPRMLNGEGGDPCFGGPKNTPMMLAHAYSTAEQSQGNWRVQAYLRPYQRAYQEWPRLLTPQWQNKIAPERDLESILMPYFNRQHRVMLRQLLELNQMEKGAQLILPKVEQLQGGAGILPLSPLFDEDIIDLSMRLPTNRILNNGLDKLIMKQSAAGRLPESIIHRPKSGMRVPVYHWFNGPLKGLAKKLLSKKNVRAAGIFDPERVHEIVNMSTEESGSRYGIWLWMLVTFELWRLKVIEGDDC